MEAAGVEPVGEPEGRSRRPDYRRPTNLAEREWWRRRESNPRPKGLSPQESTCVVGLKGSRPSSKLDERAGR